MGSLTGIRIRPDEVQGDMLAISIKSERYKELVDTVITELNSGNENLEELHQEVRSVVASAFEKKGTAPTGGRYTWMSNPDARVDNADVNNIAYSIVVKAVNEWLRTVNK